jgi:hypothetical protein
MWTNPLCQLALTASWEVEFPIKAYWLPMKAIFKRLGSPNRSYHFSTMLTALFLSFAEAISII